MKEVQVLLLIKDELKRIGDRQGEIVTTLQRIVNQIAIAGRGSEEDER